MNAATSPATKSSAPANTCEHCDHLGNVAVFTSSNDGSVLTLCLDRAACKGRQGIGPVVTPEPEPPTPTTPASRPIPYVGSGSHVLCLR